MKKNSVLKEELKEVIDKLPIYYKIMKEKSVTRAMHFEFDEIHEGYFFITDNYFKPISKIFQIDKNEKKA